MADRMSSKTIVDVEDLSGDAVDLTEITGVVKWFDVAKGFGFIVPDNGTQDVLLHVSCLRRDGYQTILEGTRIVHGSVDRRSPLAAAAGAHACAGNAFERA